MRKKWAEEFILKFFGQVIICKICYKYGTVPAVIFYLTSVPKYQKMVRGHGGCWKEKMTK